MLSKNKIKLLQQSVAVFLGYFPTLTSKESTLQNFAEQMSFFDAMFTGLKHKWKGHREFL